MNAQNACDLPSVIGMNEIPVVVDDNGIAPQRTVLIHETVNFSFPDTFFPLSSLSIDFEGDGTFVPVLPGANIEVSYPAGIHRINYSYVLPIPRSGFFDITIKATTGSYEQPDEIWTITSDAEFEPPVTVFGEENGLFGLFTDTGLGNARVSVKYAPGHNKPVKPVIFVTGYDPNPTAFTDPDLPATDNIIRHGGNGWDVFIKGADELFLNATLDQEVFKEYPQTIADLSSAGYDLIFVDFSRGGDYIQKNAELLIKTIERINEEKVPDTDGKIQPNVVIGASMGGLLTRFALKTMENRKIPHCTSTMVAFDAPLKGATAPLGVQGAIWYQHAVALNTSDTDDEVCTANQWNALITPVAGQLLENHLAAYFETGKISAKLTYFEDNWSTSVTNIPVTMPTGFAELRSQFKAEMDALGYPDKCRRIAIACGNQNGTASPLTQGGTLLNSEIMRDAFIGSDKRVLELEVYAGQGNLINQQCNNYCIDDGINGDPEQDVPQAVFAAITPDLDGESPFPLVLGPILLPFTGELFLPTDQLICAYYMGNIVVNEPVPFFDGAPGGVRTDLLSIQDNIDTLASRIPDADSDTNDIPAGNQFMTFVPTVSALDIEGEFSDELLFMNLF